MGIFLLSLIVIGLSALSFLWAVEWYRVTKSIQAKQVRELTRALRNSEKTLRRIANGSSADPALDAQIELDEITNYYSKEIA